ncbi:MAG: PilZ domain-containing protein [Leptospirillia bacterium]
MKDRRKFRRESLAPFTEIFPEDGGEPISGFPTDMSRGGLALEADDPMELGSDVTVCIHFKPVVPEEEEEEPGEDTPVEFISATVRRVMPMGKRHKVSVEFNGLSESEHPILNGVLSFIDG